MLDARSPLNAAALARCATRLAQGQPPEIAAWRHLHIDSGSAPWQDSGLAVRAGQALSYFVHGATRLKALHAVSVPARFQLWARVGAGDVLRGTRDSHSFVASSDGSLQLGNYFPGEWSSRHGDNAVPDAAYALVEGGIDVLVIAWAPGLDARRGLAALMQLDDTLASAELARLDALPATPAGWDYLWFLGPSETFHAHHDGAAACIRCTTSADAAIVHHEAELPLLPGTQLQWRWCVDALPSAVAEDSLPTHDYLSIAVEFDNGLDLTYMWSVNLPVGTVFRCPLPNWDPRETHAVVRSGSAELGQWLTEQRDVFDDYQTMIAPSATAPAPTRVLRVWLIAVSLFQRGVGACRYGPITLDNAAGRRHIA